MKIAVFVIGVVTGLAFARIPHYTGLVFALDKGPADPVGWKPKSYYFSGGVRVND